MIRIVNFSGGLCSYWAAHRTVERYGRANTLLLFADTLYESQDLYIFNRQAEQSLGLPLNRICLGLTPWELFRKEGLIGNDRWPICSTKLKREPLNRWMELHFEMDARQENMFKPPGIVVLGFDYTEEHRVSAFQQEHPSWRVEAPMTGAPYWDKCRMITEAEKLGFRTPQLYALGFPHNNCGGGCVKAGISHFVHLFRRLPETFRRWEEEEQKTIKELKARGIEPLTILKDRRDGQIKSLSLQELRMRIEAGEKFSELDWGGCGCGG